ncbi:hypothetical protein TNCV_2458861 [Trichonephila clavipes]|nr:hypothetical protein TNCV_2458861 [Trichonephila clavipes]
MYKYRCPFNFDTMPQLIHRSDWLLTSQSIGSHRPDVFYWFVVDHTIEDAPADDATSRVAADMISEMTTTFHQATTFKCNLFVRNWLDNFLI